jgi:hypothetical protein
MTICQSQLPGISESHDKGRRVVERFECVNDLKPRDQACFHASYALLLATARNNRICFLLPLQDHRKSHEPEHSRLQPRVLAQKNGHVAHKRHETQHTTHNVLLAVKEALAACVELSIICRVVVSLRQKLQRCAPTTSHPQSANPPSSSSKPNPKAKNNSPSAKLANNPVHDRDILSAHVVHNDFSHLCFHASVPEEEQVSALESRFHAAGEHDDDG